MGVVITIVLVLFAIVVVVRAVGRGKEQVKGQTTDRYTYVADQVRRLLVVVVLAGVALGLTAAPAFASSKTKISGTLTLAPSDTAVTTTLPPINCPTIDTSTPQGEADCVLQSVKANIASGNVPKDLTGTVCTGILMGDGFDDLAQGAAVVVQNQHHTTIATGELGAGKYDSHGNCIFGFSIKVPKASFYSIEISHRGPITYSATKLAKAHNRVQLTIG